MRLPRTHARRLALGLTLASAALVAACQDPTAARPTLALAPPARSSAAAPTASLDAASIDPAYAFDLPDQVGPAAGRNAIDPSQYVCPSSTPLYDWIDAAALDWIAREPATFNLLYVNLLADIVTLDAPILYATEATPQRFGYTGEFTNVMSRTERDVKTFWDIDPSNIQVVAAHGTVLLDTARVAGVYRTIFRQAAADAAVLAQVVHDAVLGSAVLNGGNHPLLSFNAVSFAGSASRHLPPKVVLGDGILEGYAAIGLGDVAPQGVFAHEYAHQIQFARGYFNDPYATTGSRAERTRYTELMADAYAAYYLTHARGAAMNKFRVAQFLQEFYDIGDCAFASSSHHGTPNQREAAAQFGFDVADQYQKQGHILTAAEFHALFVAQYPQIIAPDAP